MTAATFDPLDPAFLRDPYPAYARLREEDPVHHHPGDHRAPSFWALSRFEDIWDAVRRPEDYSSASGLTFYRDEISQLGIPPNLVMLDPPRQTRLRALIGRGFTPRRVLAMEDRIRAFVRERIVDLEHRAADGDADLHRDLASTVPTFVLAELFGVPEADRVRFVPWVHALTRLQNDGFDLRALSADEDASGGLQAMAEMMEYFSAAIAERRRTPSDDLLGALVAAELPDPEDPGAPPERLSDWDILGFCFVVTAGGTDTTASLITHSITQLTAAPEQRRILLDRPEVLANAVTEFLRLESSVQGLARTTTREVSVGGTTIPAGEKVMMLYAAGNRDPREFGPGADELDVLREIPRHLSFSSGPHFCIGNHLAKLQARISVEELLGAHPWIAVHEATSVRHESAFVRGFLRAPVASL